MKIQIMELFVLELIGTPVLTKLAAHIKNHQYPSLSMTASYLSPVIAKQSELITAPLPMLDRYEVFLLKCCLFVFFAKHGAKQLHFGHICPKNFSPFHLVTY